MRPAPCSLLHHRGAPMQEVASLINSNFNKVWQLVLLMGGMELVSHRFGVGGCSGAPALPLWSGVMCAALSTSQALLSSWTCSCQAWRRSGGCLPPARLSRQLRSGHSERRCWLSLAAGALKCCCTEWWPALELLHSVAEQLPCWMNQSKGPRIFKQPADIFAD